MLDNLKNEFKARSEVEVGLKDFKVILKQNCSEIFTKVSVIYFTFKAFKIISVFNNWFVVSKLLIKCFSKKLIYGK